MSDPPSLALIPALLETQLQLCLLESFHIFKLLLNDDICNRIIRESMCYAALINETIKIFKDEIYTLLQLFFFPATTLDRVNGRTGLRMMTENILRF